MDKLEEILTELYQYARSHPNLTVKASPSQTAIANATEQIRQQERERAEKSQTTLRTISNMSAVLQPPEKCGEVLAGINNIANEAIL